jgi:hypothetical protein
VALLAVLVWPAVAIRQAAPREQYIDGAGTLHRTADGTVLTVAGDARPASALRALRALGVEHLDIVVLPSAGRAMEVVVAVIERRIPVDRVVTEGARSAGSEASD